MRINQNISAMNTYSRLTSANTAKSNSLQKLSSGLRINKAGDDAAGLAISEKMRGQISGLNQAAKNAQDGISLIQTAEGALNETHSILQRMRELAVQSATDTNTNDDRAKIQGEIDQLSKEITRISNTTEFNNQNLMAGGLNNTFHVGANSGQNVGLNIKAMDAATLGIAGKAASASGATNGIKGASFSGEEQGTAVVDENVITVTVTGVAGAAAGTGGAAVGGITVSTTNNTDALNGLKIKFVDGDDDAAAGSAVYDKDLNEMTITADLTAGTNTTFTANTVFETLANAALAGKGINETLSFSGTTAAGLAGQTLTITNGSHGIATISAIGTETGAAVETTTVAANAKSVDLSGTKYGGIKLDLNDGNDLTTSSTIKVTIIGSKAATTNADGSVLKEATSAAGIDVSTQKAADKAITTINSAIESVSSERSKLGALQNRLDHTINNLTTSSENLTAAESRIRDVDMAQEMMEFTKNNILSQAATSMLAQANQAPQAVLQLLQ